MQFAMSESLDLLRRTPAVLRALLEDTDPAWHTTREGDGSWSPLEVVGHMLHAEETDWIPRARTILEHGVDAPFEPFDRFAHLDRFRGVPLTELLERFAAARRQSLDTVERFDLGDGDLDRAGTHPQLGRVTLRQLIATWTIHDLTHLAQITRALARRYDADVGPWREYLGILRDR